MPVASTLSSVSAAQESVIWSCWAITVLVCCTLSTCTQMNKVSALLSFILQVSSLSNACVIN